MKALGISICVTVFLLGVWGIAAEVFADYALDKEMGSYWSLSVKASTLEAKSQYLNHFIKAVEDSQLSGNDAIWLKTPDNSYEQNIFTLRTLQARMNDIKGMDITSFAYQQAIQQITAQEQDEADKVLSVIAGVWYLKNHPLLWGWIDFLKWLAMAVVGVIGLFIAGVYWEA